MLKHQAVTFTLFKTFLPCLIIRRSNNRSIIVDAHCHFPLFSGLEEIEGGDDVIDGSHELIIKGFTYARPEPPTL